ncbi:MAG: hypothetical protein WEB88_05675 [Gemmatimonadota bacterium]
MTRWIAAAALAPLLTVGCAVRLGGPEPVEMVVSAGVADEGADAGALAAQLGAADTRVALLAAPMDSAWFGAVATAAGMELSGPGPAGTTRLAFLTRGLELLGDTTIALEVASGGQVFVHDAIYRLDERRLVDLIYARVLPGVGVREGVRAMLNYIATEVGDDAGLVVALAAPSDAAADSAATMMLAYLENARECDGDGMEETPATGGLRLFYGPGARIRCVGTSQQAGPPAVLVNARVIVGR